MFPAYLPLRMACNRQYAKEQAIKALELEKECVDDDFRKLQAKAQRQGWQLTRTRTNSFMLKRGAYSVHSHDLQTVADRLKPAQN